MALELKDEPAGSEGRQPPAPPLSYEQFLEWVGEDTLAEWVDGKVMLLSPASLPHQEIVLFLARLLAEFAEIHNAGKVLTAPFQMKLSNVRRGREPDLLFVATAHLDRLTHNYLDGPADLVVEVVSPESVLRDRGEKYAEYELEGVREYWVLDPEAQRADFFVLGADGRYERARLDQTDAYRCAVLPGLWLKVSWLWQSPLPSLRDVLHEWGLV